MDNEYVRNKTRKFIHKQLRRGACPPILGEELIYGAMSIMHDMSYSCNAVRDLFTSASNLYKETHGDEINGK